MKGTTKKLFRNISSVALAVITGLSFLPSAFVSAEDAGSNVEPVISTVEETDAAIDSMDFSSKRLMVFSSNPEVQTALMNSNGYISSYSQMFLLQFETENEAKSAYRQFVPIADVVEIDTGIQIADDVVAAEEVSTDTVMTVEDNPIRELQELVQEGSASYDIALIDTGASVDSNVTSSVSVIGEDASDHHGHGTAMKGYMVEQNPNAAILSIKALDDSGKGDISSVYAALEYAKTQNVKIINLSMSALASSENEIIKTSIQEAVQNGTIVVGAAGNNGKDAGYYLPGSVSEAIIVGAASENGTKLSTSNFGETVDYNVVADATSSAAAKMSGWLSAHSVDTIATVLNQGLIYETSFTKLETEEQDKHTLGQYQAYRPDDLFYAAQDAWVTGWADGELGEGDFAFGITDSTGAHVAYCLNLGANNPNGAFSAFNHDVAAKLGFLFKSLQDGGVLSQAMENLMLSPDASVRDYYGMYPRYAVQIAVWILNGQRYEVDNGVNGLCPRLICINAGRQDVYDTAVGWADWVNQQAATRNLSEYIQYAQLWAAPQGSGQQNLVSTTYEPPKGMLKIGKYPSIAPPVLTVQKQVTGNGGDTNKDFYFTITYTPDGGTQRTEQFSLKHGQQKQFTCAPGSSYRVTETADDRYTITPTSQSYSGAFNTFPADAVFTFKVAFWDGQNYWDQLYYLRANQDQDIGPLYEGIEYDVQEINNLPANEWASWTVPNTALHGHIVGNAYQYAGIVNQYKVPGQTVTFTNERNNGFLALKKESAQTDVTDNNACYSLDNAKYAVYSKEAGFTSATAKAAAIRDGKGVDQDLTGDSVTNDGRYGTFVINADGIGHVVGAPSEGAQNMQLPTGDYFIVETKASQGYKLDATVHEVTITKGPAAQVKTVTYSDVPALDPDFIELHKVPFVQNTIRDDVEGVPVENAYFLLEYFDNHTFTGPATRQWILKTDENGLADFRESYIVPSLTVDGRTYTSSDFYITEHSNQISIPIGCVKLTEIQSPAGYKKIDTVLQAQVNESWHPRTGERIADFDWQASTYLKTTTDDSAEGGQVKAELGEVQKYGSFVIKKEDKETTRLQGDSTFVGIEYEIQNITKDKNGNPKDIVLESGERVPANGTFKGPFILRDETGSITIEGVPQGTYKVTEKKSNDSFLPPKRDMIVEKIGRKQKERDRQNDRFKKCSADRRHR